MPDRRRIKLVITAISGSGNFQTDEIVCPFCGYKYDESYEYIGEEMIECDECGKKFELESEEVVYYTTKKPDWLRQWRIYNNNQILRSKFRREKATRAIPTDFGARLWRSTTGTGATLQEMRMRLKSMKRNIMSMTGIERRTQDRMINELAIEIGQQYR